MNGSTKKTIQTYKTGTERMEEFSRRIYPEN